MEALVSLGMGVVFIPSPKGRSQLANIHSGTGRGGIRGTLVKGLLLQTLVTSVKPADSTAFKVLGFAPSASPLGRFSLTFSSLPPLLVHPLV